MATTPLTVECTGIAAGWCPIHGDCTCRNDEGGAEGEADGEEWDGLNRWDCPLHGRASTHPEEVWTADPLDVLRAAL